MYDRCTQIVRKVVNIHSITALMAGHTLLFLIHVQVWIELNWSLHPRISSISPILSLLVVLILILLYWWLAKSTVQWVIYRDFNWLESVLLHHLFGDRKSIRPVKTCFSCLRFSYFCSQNQAVPRETLGNKISQVKAESCSIYIVMFSVDTVAGICNSADGVFFWHATTVPVPVAVANIGRCQG